MVQFQKCTVQKRRTMHGASFLNRAARNWICLTLGRNEWSAFANTVMNLLHKMPWISWLDEEMVVFLCFSRSTPLQAVSVLSWVHVLTLLRRKQSPDHPLTCRSNSVTLLYVREPGHKLYLFVPFINRLGVLLPCSVRTVALLSLYFVSCNFRCVAVNARS